MKCKLFYKSRFSDSQYVKIADICSDIAMLTLASLVVPSIFDKKYSPGFIIFGIIFTIVLYILSIIMLKDK